MKNFTVNSKLFSDQITFSFSRKDLINVIKAIYADMKQKNLNIYGISTKFLKEYITSERDMLRKITRIPTDEFR
jgi:hypothetical protein